MDLFLLSSVSHQIFYYLPVHQRLAPEEINFQIPSASGICDQKVQRPLSHLITHQCPATVILSFFRKTIFAGKVTIVGDMQAQSLYHSLPCLKIQHSVFIDILREQNAGILQRITLLQRFCQFPDIVFAPQTGNHRIVCISLIQQFHHIIDNIVHHMYGAAVHINNNVITIVFVLMDHC